MRYVHARAFPRPWPADPAKYPLSGPTRGPVACPPHKASRATWIIVGAAFFVAYVVGWCIGLALFGGAPL